MAARRRRRAPATAAAAATATATAITTAILEDGVAQSGSVIVLFGLNRARDDRGVELDVEVELIKERHCSLAFLAYRIQLWHPWLIQTRLS